MNEWHKNDEVADLLNCPKPMQKQEKWYKGTR